jgi:hypothetical protein
MIGPLYDEVQGPDAGGDAPDVGPIDVGLPKVTPGSGPPTPASIRSRLHVICALYAHTPQPDRRLALLDHLERMTLEAAESLAAHLLASGWRPRNDTPEAA